MLPTVANPLNPCRERPVEFRPPHKCAAPPNPHPDARLTPTCDRIFKLRTPPGLPSQLRGSRSCICGQLRGSCSCIGYVDVHGPSPAITRPQFQPPALSKQSAPQAATSAA
ncbi:hypothetical protein KC19_VG218800 [Ceratodon purpureus]|uniref:Uncharacterized protein n=1 Tax=Ceratodon purpureus TaxID=3225 RepID=A0A8T0HT16_CERPU|nr:hypothetical protein KC19_VG218800 [Ceratodon purpureus]